MRQPDLRLVILAALCLASAGCSLFRPDSSRSPVGPTAEALLKDGDSRLAAGEFDAGASSLNELLTTHPQSELAPQAIFQLAGVYLSPESPLYDPDRGTEVLASLAETHAGSPVASAAEAILALLRKTVDPHEEDVVPPSISESESLLQAGNERRETGDAEGAAEAFREVVTDHPESQYAPEAMFHLAVLHLDVETALYDRKGGIEMLSTLSSQDPNSTWAIAAAAIVSLSRSNVDLRRAVSLLRGQLDQLKQIDLDPDG